MKLPLLKFTLLKKIQESPRFYLSFLIMHVGGKYFINHKKKDFFPEGTGLLHLSVSTLKE